MKALIATLPGDGIGPEVTRQAQLVLETVAAKHGHEFVFRSALIGGAAIDAEGTPLPPSTLSVCREADAVFLGAVGGPKWADGEIRPEQGLLGLRRELGVFGNLRPVKGHPRLAEASPLKADRIDNLDIMFVRELTGGVYFGEKKEGRDRAEDTCVYTRKEVDRVVRLAAGLARQRSGRLTSIDKANVLATSRLWRAVCTEVMADDYADVQLEHLLVDAAAMHLVRAPSRFDVIVTENMFGDILTDEASVLCGSLGMLPSASLSDSKKGLYEPIHGSAPDIAGTGRANPYGAILSGAMLLRYSLDLAEEARQVERAVDDAISASVLADDLAISGTGRSTEEIGAEVVGRLT